MGEKSGYDIKKVGRVCGEGENGLIARDRPPDEPWESRMDFYQNHWILQFQSQHRQRPKIEFNIVMSEQFRTLFTVQIFIRIIFL